MSAAQYEVYARAIHAASEKPVSLHDVPDKPGRDVYVRPEPIQAIDLVHYVPMYDMTVQEIPDLLKMFSPVMGRSVGRFWPRYPDMLD